MTHQEFVRAYKEGTIDVYINKKEAFLLIGDYKWHSPVLRIFKVIYYILTWVWFLSIPFAVVCFIYFGLEIAIIVLIFFLIEPTIFKIITAKIVLNQSLKNEDLYNWLIVTKILVIRETS